MKTRTEYAVFDCPHPTIPGERVRYELEIIIEEADHTEPHCVLDTDGGVGNDR